MVVSLLRLLVAAVASSVSIPLFVTAETTPIIDELNGKISPTPPRPGYNVEGTSVFTNFARAFDEKQFFLVNAASATLYQKPDTEPVQGTLFSWCSDLTFSDFSNSSLVGYAGNCVAMLLAYGPFFSGAQIQVEYVKGEFTAAIGISAVYVEQQNIFEGQVHAPSDDDYYRYWDSGLKTMPTIGWEGYDAGDMHPNAATSSFSLFGELAWLSTEEAAQFDDFHVIFILITMIDTRHTIILSLLLLKYYYMYYETETYVCLLRSSVEWPKSSEHRYSH